MAGRTMIAFGGAAPLHAARLAQKIGVSRVLIPVGAGVGSAHGFLQAPISYEVVRTRVVSLKDYAPAAVAELFEAMRAEAEGVVRVGAPSAELHEERIAYMRYRGQGHEVRVPVPPSAFGPDGATALRLAFEKVYQALYGRTIPRLDVEAVSWTLSLAERRHLPDREDPPAAQPAPPAQGKRALLDPCTGTAVEAQVYARDLLSPGAAVSGPAVITEAETSTLVPSGFVAALNRAGHIVIERTA
jgi:N-methylhydantoinase A